MVGRQMLPYCPRCQEPKSPYGKCYKCYPAKLKKGQVDPRGANMVDRATRHARKKGKIKLTLEQKRNSAHLMLAWTLREISESIGYAVAGGKLTVIDQERLKHARKFVLPVLYLFQKYLKIRRPRNDKIWGVKYTPFRKVFLAQNMDLIWGDIRKLYGLPEQGNPRTLQRRQRRNERESMGITTPTNVDTKSRDPKRPWRKRTKPVRRARYQGPKKLDKAP